MQRFSSEQITRQAIEQLFSRITDQQPSQTGSGPDTYVLLPTAYELIRIAWLVCRRHHGFTIFLAPEEPPVNVGEICNHDAATVCATASLEEAAERLSNSYADAVVVITSPVQRPTAIGVITYRELVNKLTCGADLKRVRVIDVLDRYPIVLHEEETIENAVLKLRSRGAKHAHVVGKGGTLRGIISMDRLLGCRHAAELGSRARAPVADITHK